MSATFSANSGLGAYAPAMRPMQMYAFLSEHPPNCGFAGILGFSQRTAIPARLTVERCFSTYASSLFLNAVPCTAGFRGRCPSYKLGKTCKAKRLRHLPTRTVETPSSLETCWFFLPSAQASSITTRSTIRRSALWLRDNFSR